jgi:hypothetical protein
MDYRRRAREYHTLAQSTREHSLRRDFEALAYGYEDLAAHLEKTGAQLAHQVEGAAQTVPRKVKCCDVC